MGSIQRELQPSISKGRSADHGNGLERIARKARCEPNLHFTSLAHHITRDRVERNLDEDFQPPAAGVDGQTAEAARRALLDGSGRCSNPSTVRDIVHRLCAGSHPEARQDGEAPIGVPTIADRALQRSAAEVAVRYLRAGLLACSFGGRPKLNAFMPWRPQRGQRRR